jgi:uncharacterized protein (TIGR02231 family)
MKFYLLLSLLFLTFYGSASDKKVKSTIQAVTVFRTGAQIYSTANANLQKGQQLIIFTDLSNGINPASIQVNGQGDFTIMSVTHQINYLEEIVQTKRIQSLTDSLKMLNQQIQLNNQYIAAYKEEVSLLQSNKTLQTTDGNLKLAEIKAAADYYRLRFREIYTNWLKINQENESLQLEINKLSQTLNQLQANHNPKGVGEIIVEIDAEQATAASFELSYLVYNAGWNPSYDLRAIDVNKAVELHYRANIYQNSGVDWNNVKLSVSTGNPTESGVIPNLYPWYLNYYNPSQNRNNNQGYAQSPPMAIDKEDASLSEVRISTKTNYARNSTNYTSVTQGQTNTTFEISLPYNIPSTNKTVNVKVQKWELPATYRYYAAPRLDPVAFLQARITGWENLNLVAGEVNIFFEGTYVGKSYLNTANLSDTLDLSLGRDKNIIIQRNKVKDKSNNSILGSTKKMNIAWNIEVRNNKKTKVKLVIQDQIPLSNTKEIEISLGEKTGASLNPENGFLTWQFELDTKQNKTLNFSYEVKYPKELVISNMW